MTHRKPTMFVVLFLALTLLSSPFLASASSIDRARQYALDGETAEYLGVVKIGNNDYQVFKFTSARGDLSSIIILDETGNRVDKETCLFFNWGCSRNEELARVIFSTLTYEYATDHQPTISNGLQQIYDSMIQDAHNYSSKWDKIREGVEYVVNNVDLKLRFNIVELDVSPLLRKLALEKVGGFLPNNPKWEDILPRFRDFKENIEQIGMFKDRKQLSYDNEVVFFYTNLKAVKEFLKVVDEKTGSNLVEKLADLNLDAEGLSIGERSITEINGIEVRVETAKQQSLDVKASFDEKLKELVDAINRAFVKDMDLKKYKEEYCGIKDKLDPGLIDEEQFKEFRDEASGLISKSDSSIKSLNLKMTEYPDRPFWDIFGVWLNQISWAISKGC